MKASELRMAYLNGLLTEQEYTDRLAVAEADYAVVDAQTGRVVSRHTDRKQASRKADRLDQAYGACRYLVRIV